MKRWTLSGLIIALVVVSIPLAVCDRKARVSNRSAQLDARGVALVEQLRATKTDVWVQTTRLRSLNLYLWFNKLHAAFGPPASTPAWTKARASIVDSALPLESIAADPFAAFEPMVLNVVAGPHGDPAWFDSLSTERQQAWRDLFAELHLPLADPNILAPVMAANPDVVGMSVVPQQLDVRVSIDTFGNSEPLTVEPMGGSRTIGNVTVVPGFVDDRPVRLYKAETPVGAGRLRFIVILPEPE